MNFNKLCIHADRGRQFELRSGKNLYLQNYRMNVSIQVSPPNDKKVKKPVIVPTHFQFLRCGDYSPAAGAGVGILENRASL